MSYGVWRKRGKGWSSIEIDSPWNETMYDLERYNPERYKSLKSQTGADGEDNPHYAQWSYGQERKGRTIEHLPTDGEHGISVAFDNEEARAVAMEVFKDQIYTK